MKFLILFLISAMSFAQSNIPISGLPTGLAEDSGTNDVFPYVHAASATTKKMRLWDLVNLPVFANNVEGTPGSPINISVAGITTISSTIPNQIIFVQGYLGPVTVTANPQIKAHTVTGARLTVIGSSDTNTLTMENGDGIRSNGPIILLNGYVIEFMWDSASWLETSRNF